jgi:hypothetical protein
LTLVRSVVPESPFFNTLILEYRWDEGPSSEEARKLCKRSIVYIACAIYDAAQAVGLPCQPSPIPNSQRPAWYIPGEQSRVSVTLSEIHDEIRICHMLVGAMITEVGVAPGSTEHLNRLKAGFEDRFRVITV